MKARKTEKSLVVGLDVGTSKIVAIVGEGQPDGSVEVIGLGSSPSTGLKRGVVVDVAGNPIGGGQVVTVLDVHGTNYFDINVQRYNYNIIKYTVST